VWRVRIRWWRSKRLDRESRWRGLYGDLGLRGRLLDWKIGFRIHNIVGGGGVGGEGGGEEMRGELVVG